MTQAQLTRDVATPLGLWVKGAWITILGHQITLAPTSLAYIPEAMTLTLPADAVKIPRRTSTPRNGFRCPATVFADLYLNAAPDAQERADRALGPNSVDRAVRRHDTTLEVVA